MVVALTARYSAYAPIPLVVPNTASPGAHAATSLPICSTTPENSWPGIHGRSIGSICLAVPEASTRSRWLTAVLLTLTKISSRAIVGVGTSLNTNCPPYSNNLTAFMLGSLSLLNGRHARGASEFRTFQSPSLHLLDRPSERA